MNDYEEILNTLDKGGIILYPTDTVWGLGCDATNPEAVSKIFKIKGREDSKALVLLACDTDMICRYIEEMPYIAEELINVNDKPMTIVYPDALTGEKPEAGKKTSCNKNTLAFNVVAEDKSVAIRVPQMEFCINLIRKFGRPIVSTSANLSGAPTPKNFGEISREIKDSADAIVSPDLEKGSTGLPSQIIKVMTDGQIKIIRA